MARHILDCTSLNSTVDSLCRLLNTSHAQFERIAMTSDVDWNDPVVPGEEQIAGFFSSSSATLPTPDAIRWFHATRAFRQETFSEGLLPTQAVLPKLWDSLGTVAARWSGPREWLAYRESFDRGGRRFADQFHRKAMVNGWEGPFAFLVKDAAIGLHDAHKDFFRASEAIEDICADYEEVYGRPLLEAYQAATERCLVIFCRPGDWYGAVTAALNYAYREVRGLRHGHASNAVFSGEGRGVPRQWIENVEWL